MLRPPRELGSDDFNQAQSDRGLPARSDRAALMVSSQWAVPCLMWSGGHALSKKETLGRARHERRRAVSIWESCRSDSLARDSFTFSTFVEKVLSQKEEGPIGQPRREKPPLVIGMSGGRGLLEGSVSSGM